MKVHYKLRSDYMLDDEGEYYHTYGVEVCFDEGESQKLADISLDRDAVEEFVQKCNTNELSPLHLTDVIENEFF